MAAPVKWPAMVDASDVLCDKLLLLLLLLLRLRLPGTFLFRSSWPDYTRCWSMIVGGTSPKQANKKMLLGIETQHTEAWR